MDGNGRWAEKRGMPRMLGHAEGGKTFKKIVRHCKDIGIKYVTLYAFSTENWKRSEEEVSGLMKLFKQHINEAKGYAKEKTRIIFLGDKAPFDSEIRSGMLELEEKSAEFDRFTVMMAMNYGGRADIVNAAKRAASMLCNKEIKPEDFDESLIGSLLYTGIAPDVDLLIRPGGERRLSNFLLWQSAYAELYFSNTLWPDFTVKELDRILEDFSARNRRFGGY
ncbi:MAG: polyprenyl diphosphate synthase [Oscillospiraceae bacterium]|nr:polyprenyl diphosphate synthase [Oscillospiraceae bacterium]